MRDDIPINFGNFAEPIRGVFLKGHPLGQVLEFDPEEKKGKF